MATRTKEFERVTISLPKGVSKQIEQLQKDLRLSKSELFRTAFERFSEEHRKEKLRKIAQEMAEEYRSDERLTEFTSLDSEEFK